MKKEDHRWTKEQTIVTFNLYCKIPFNKVTSRHPEIQRIAKVIGRSTNSVKMKIGNFGSFDPELRRRGIVGLSNASKLDETVWNEFNQNWEELAFESEKILLRLGGGDSLSEFSGEDDNFFIPEGIDKVRLVKARINQSFFRQTVLSAYNFTCCITKIDVPELLIASHIVPWREAAKDRLNPRNGLCLNAFHDRAFDIGLITITPDLRIKVSSRLMEKQSTSIESWIIGFNGKEVTTPERFVPTKEFLEYHNNNIFQG